MSASKRSQSTADIICERLAVGESLRSICRRNDLPDFSNVYRWLEDDPQFRKQYARARECQADALADEIMDIARAATPKEAQATKVRMDGLIWAASKINKTKYGNDNKTEVNVNAALVILDPAKQTQLQDRRKAAEALLIDKQ